MNFPERLKKVIKKTGLKREEFYERVGISKSQLFNYLGGRSEPTLSFFQRLKLEFPWVDLEWLTVGSAGSYTIPNDKIPIVATAPADPREAMVLLINHMLEKMDEETVKDVMTYTADKKIVMEYLKEHQKNKRQVNKKAA